MSCIEHSLNLLSTKTDKTAYIRMKTYIGFLKNSMVGASGGARFLIFVVKLSEYPMKLIEP